MGNQRDGEAERSRYTVVGMTMLATSFRARYKMATRSLRPFIPNLEE